MSFAEKPFDQLQRFRIHIKSIIKAGRLGFCPTIHPLIRHHHNNYILSKSISSAPKLIIITSSDHVQVDSCCSLSSAHRFLTDSLSIIYSESPRRLPACLPPHPRSTDFIAPDQQKQHFQECVYWGAKMYCNFCKPRHKRADHF